MLNSIVVNKAYMLPTSAIISCPSQRQIHKDQGNARTTTHAKKFWIKETPKFEVDETTSLVLAYSNYNKVSAAQYNEVYLCVFCKYPHSRAIPRGRATFELRDNIGSITATVIVEAAEKFFDYCAEERMHQDTMETKALEFPSTNKQSSSLSISTILGEQESNIHFGALSEPQEKKLKQEESMHPDDDVTTFNSDDDVDKNNYSFSDGTSSVSKERKRLLKSCC
ncbi:replication protein A 70 kDa DNA-binding subunit B-like [Abeliophyllum distichum]|uniref:Replication protein A 70 kDa DNA-binding subunit B-like n=1 Tax=Abeliophyllum distichum TaxID=126358 RepID=A0ABD1RVA9_9LAMI